MAPTSPKDFEQERNYCNQIKSELNNNYYFNAGYKNCLLRTLRLVRKYPNLKYIIKRLEEENSN